MICFTGAPLRASAELDGKKPSEDLRPGRGEGPYIVAAQLLGDADIKARKKYDGTFETGPLSDEPDTATYSSQHFKAIGRAETWDVALRMWKLDPAKAQERYDELLSSLPNISEKDEIASSRGLVSGVKSALGVMFAGEVDVLGDFGLQARKPLLGRTGA